MFKYKNPIIKLFFVGLFVFCSLAIAVPATVDAQGSVSDCDVGQNENLDTGNCEIIRYLRDGVNVLSAVVGIIIVTMVAVGGIQYSASRDNPQETAAAKQRIQNALLAVVVYIFTFAFLQWLVPGGLF